MTSKMTLAREIENFTSVGCKKRHPLSKLGVPVLTMEVGRANGAPFSVEASGIGNRWLRKLASELEAALTTADPS